MAGAVHRLALARDASGGRGERGIHDHDARHRPAGQDVVQLLGVLAGERRSGKEIGQQRTASLRELVEHQVGAGELRPDREIPRAG
jgi:hypothetical protein